VTEEDLRLIAAPYGEITDMELPHWPNDPTLCRGNAFIEYAKKEDASRAAEQLNLTMLRNHCILVRLCPYAGNFEEVRAYYKRLDEPKKRPMPRLQLEPARRPDTN